MSAEAYNAKLMAPDALRTKRPQHASVRSPSILTVAISSTSNAVR